MDSTEWRIIERSVIFPDVWFLQEKQERQHIGTLEELNAIPRDPLLMTKSLCPMKKQFFKNPFKRRPYMTRTEIIKKVAEELFLTMKYDGACYTFIFPDMWDLSDVFEAKICIEESIKALEHENTPLFQWFKRNQKHVHRQHQILFQIEEKFEDKSFCAFKDENAVITEGKIIE